MTPPREETSSTPKREYWGLQQRATFFVALATLVAFIFSIGVNYNKLSSNTEKLDQFIRDANILYVRRDVQSEQLRNMQMEIEALRYEVQDLNATIVGNAAAEPTGPSPRFERK